jgi:hypothetical protein
MIYVNGMLIDCGEVVMEYLFAVDVQKEFVKDEEGIRIYNKCISFIKREGFHYTIIAPVYQNKTNSNIERLLDWHEMKQIMPGEFVPDFTIIHSGYSIDKYVPFTMNDKVHVFGFDTDACVLSTCFDLFNFGVDFDILSDLCWSSGGKKMHEAGLMIMERQFGSAVTVSEFR